MLFTSQIPARSSPFRWLLGLSRSRGAVSTLLVGCSLTLASVPSSVSASAALVSYTTSGSIDATGVTGPPVVDFVATNGATNTSAPFSLGSFRLVATGAGVTQYDQTPFTIAYSLNRINGTTTTGTDGTAITPMLIHGWLSGTVGGTNPAGLSVLFDQGLQPADPRFYQPRPLPPFPAGSSVSGGSTATTPGFLTLNNGQSLLTLTTTGNGLTSIPASLDLASNVPEPATLLVFLTFGGGLLVVRNSRKRQD